MDPTNGTSGCPRPARSPQDQHHYPLRSSRPARPPQHPHHYPLRSPRPARPRQHPHHYPLRSPRPARPAGRRAALLAYAAVLAASRPGRPAHGSLRSPFAFETARFARRLAGLALRVPQAQHRDRTTALPSRLPHPRVLTARVARRSPVRRRSRLSRRPARVRSSPAHRDSTAARGCSPRSTRARHADRSVSWRTERARPGGGRCEGPIRANAGERGYPSQRGPPAGRGLSRRWRSGWYRVRVCPLAIRELPRWMRSGWYRVRVCSQAGRELPRWMRSGNCQMRICSSTSRGLSRWLLFG